MSGKAITAIAGAVFPRIESEPQKQQIKLIAKEAKNNMSKNLLSGRRNETAMIIGRQSISQFAKIFAKIKISKFSQERKTCSKHPSSKSLFKNSAEEKIRQDKRENQIMIEA